MLKLRLIPQIFIYGFYTSVLAFLMIFYFIKSDKETVYIDTVKLFNGFVMTKEMKRIGEKEFNSRKLVLDNLYSNLQSPAISDSEKKQLMQKFIQGKEELQHFNQTFAGEQTAKIWSRIKSYTAEFSKDKNYQLVIGSADSQLVLFADEKIDITSELLTFLNKKYEGI